jgi:CCR4-NOT transcription complex subunit 4
MSTAARALLDDVKARRESALPISCALSPFPDFDRTLQTLSGEDGGGFSFNLDPKLADEANSVENLSEFDVTSTIAFHGSYLDAFPALRSGSPYAHSPSLGYSQIVTHPIYDPSAARATPGSLLEKQTARGASYFGSFNPFSEPSVDNVPSLPSRSSFSPIDDERKVSRFGFARGRQSSTATSSPLYSMASLNLSSDGQPFYHPPDEPVHPWPPGFHDVHIPSPLSVSPVPRSDQAQPTFAPHQDHLQLLTGGDLSEAQLRSFIQSSQEGENGVARARTTLGNCVAVALYHCLLLTYFSFAEPQQSQFPASQPFEDPAIMSASLAVPSSVDHGFPSYGPPPGLPVPQRLSPSPALPQAHQNGGMSDRRNNLTQGEFFVSCIKGREASVPSTVLSQCGTSIANDPSSKFFSPPSVLVNSPLPIIKT